MIYDENCRLARSVSRYHGSVARSVGLVHVPMLAQVMACIRVNMATECSTEDKEMKMRMVEVNSAGSPN